MRKRQGRRELGSRKRKRNSSSTNHVEATPLEDGVVVTPCWGGDVNIFVFAEVGNKLASGTERASAGEDLDAASTFKRWVVLTEGKPAAALHHAYCDDVIACTSLRARPAQPAATARNHHPKVTKRWMLN